MCDRVATRTGLEVDHEFLDPRPGDNGLLSPVLRAGGVPHRLEGIDDQHELDDLEEDDEAARGQNPSREAESHRQIVSRTWRS